MPVKSVKLQGLESKVAKLSERIARARVGLAGLLEQKKTLLSQLAQQRAAERGRPGKVKTPPADSEGGETD